MKKLMVALTAMLAVGLFACSGGDNGPTEESATEGATSEGVSSASRYVFTCSGTTHPCSEEEFYKVLSSKQYLGHGQFVRTTSTLAEEMCSMACQNTGTGAACPPLTN